jgi:hypothetical protein
LTRGTFATQTQQPSGTVPFFYFTGSASFRHLFTVAETFAMTSAARSLASNHKHSSMVKVNTYITFNGDCEEAFNFYKSVFGGEFAFLGRFKDMPPVDGRSAPEGKAKKLCTFLCPSAMKRF